MRADEARTRAAALAPSTTLLTFSSKLQDTRAAAGVKPNALLREADLMVCTFSSLEFEAKATDVLHEAEATEAAMAAPSSLLAAGL